MENTIWGIHPVIEAIETAKKIEKIFIKKDSRTSEALEKIRDKVRGTSIIVQDVPAEKLDRLTKRGNHQGVVALMQEIDYLEFSDLLERIASTETPPLIVAMDSVTDVRNFGAIARSAECAGADAVIMSAKNSAPVNGEAIRSSAGALNVIPVCRVGSLRNALKSLQTSGVQLVAATEKSNKILFECDFTRPTVIIMGSEDKGIAGDILKMCDEQIAIPLLGKIESLNVSAAASVMLYEALRQRFMAME
ncbi:23S rRNA (guanosine-2'-O-)-methyltransferase rlmB [Mucinivorans hirudinis]|uniref:23S rRNA (Guanosine-2'-O-)-methyltransferase rlmB n=1 Tax=Mucinivorans hirudinis TaxID=1433126 RepID=A0A060R8E4_9BACT|nr:23S rRNA (guanosine-2'-O-)-methyltransferase rlmB [Mucinivorans hirudinis]